MADLKDRVSSEIIAAMKAKDKTRLNVLRYIKKLFIENDTSKSPIDELDIVISYAKKTRDSLTLYPESTEQHQEILAELKIMDEYLPAQLNEEQVIAMIKEIKASLASPNMGLVMKELSAKIKGQFDGKRATELVKENI